MSAPEYTEIGSVDRSWSGPPNKDGFMSMGVTSTPLSLCSMCGTVVADTAAHGRFHEDLRRIQMGFPAVFGGGRSI